ncbi:DUF4261 domain-containing protein [Dysgonomonas sp. 216]|uniref:DUF4261 domain-containing protein n=1 Tax=Dysgonomonas sp. 216 TaxID=2302934 RepID=UPI0013D7F974|nr:DUF4261 domain-containing protein [Dysgonomonas sp. 216]NDW17886.1 DUF4261 domain-containing protein [Dysgonomonas sp. 216]
MGIFDFFKKKTQDTTPSKTESENSESRILLAMPMFKNNESYNIQKVIEHLKSFWQVEITEDEGASDETAVFNIDGQMVAIAKMPAPIPYEDIVSVASYNYLWPNALDVLKDHTGHVIVTVMSGDLTPVDRFRILSKMLVSILSTSNCVGIYQGNETLLLSKEYYLNCVEDLQSGSIPVPLWVYIGVRVNDENKVSIYTYGLTNFYQNEMEIIESDKDAQELYNFILNITSYVIENDVTLKDGETIGYSADHKIAIKVSKGVFVEGKTIKFEL